MASQYELTDDQELEQDADDVEINEEELSVSAESDKARPPEDFNIASRQKLREELSSQIESFLANGGRINEVPSHSSTERPGKPASEFTGRLM